MKTTYSRRYQRLLAALKRIRKAKQLTQQDLAKRLQRPQSFVSKYENAERRLDVAEFLEVADALGADPMALLRNMLAKPQFISKSRSG